MRQSVVEMEKAQEGEEYNRRHGCLSSVQAYGLKNHTHIHTHYLSKRLYKSRTGHDQPISKEVRISGNVKKTEDEMVMV